MKKKYVTIMLSFVLGASVFAGCGSAAKSQTTETATEAAGDSEKTDAESSATERTELSNAVYGEIASIDGDKITVNIGTVPKVDNDAENGALQKENKDTDTVDAASQEENKDTDTVDAASQEENKDFEAISLELTGETMEITLDDSVKLTKSSPGGGWGMMPPNGENTDGSGQTPPENPADIPEGQATEGAESDDSAQAPPNMPEGEMPDGADFNGSGQAPPNMPEGEMPDGADFNGSGQTPPNMPEGEMPNGEEFNAEDFENMPNMNGQEESISVSDLKEGDTLAIICDEDGNVTAVQLVDPTFPAMRNK